MNVGWLPFPKITKFKSSECNKNSDCDKEKEKCDLIDHICRKECTLKEDCKGVERTCDVNRGFCVNGKLIKSILNFKMILSLLCHLQADR